MNKQEAKDKLAELQKIIDTTSDCDKSGMATLWDLITWLVNDRVDYLKKVVYTE